MRYGVYVVQDVKSTFGSLIVESNDAVAMRSFSTAVQRSDSTMFSYPADFRLWKLGEYDNESASITLLDVPKLICGGEDVIK